VYGNGKTHVKYRHETCTTSNLIWKYVNCKKNSTYKNLRSIGGGGRPKMIYHSASQLYIVLHQYHPQQRTYMQAGSVWFVARNIGKQSHYEHSECDNGICVSLLFSATTMNQNISSVSVHVFLSLQMYHFTCTMIKNNEVTSTGSFAH
jgi:hypothetical protein